MRDVAKPGAGTEMRVVEYTPMPPIRTAGATSAEPSAPVRWTTVLVWFMRTMAVVWITKGLFAWSVVLGINHAVSDLLELPPVMRGLIGFYAVADLMAAVGLWLAAPWGGVLWLICAASEVMAATLGAGASLTGILGMVLDIALIIVYFALSWLAANERL
jgi:Family of unknown function (DUF6163)